MSSSEGRSGPRSQASRVRQRSAACGGRRTRLIDFGELVWGNAEPEQRMYPDPAIDDLYSASPLETTRRGDQRWILDTCRQTETFKPTHELPILHHRHRTKSAESVVHRATDKNP